MANKETTADKCLRATSVILQNIIKQLFWQYSVLMRMKKALFQDIIWTQTNIPWTMAQGKKGFQIQGWEPGKHFTVVWKGPDHLFTACPNLSVGTACEGKATGSAAKGRGKHMDPICYKVLDAVPRLFLLAQLCLQFVHIAFQETSF